jgi:hypothetical protein
VTDTGETRPTTGGADTDSLRIFLNYRRDDSAGHAGRLYDSLTERFGEQHVFMDVDKIAPGTDYVDAIDDAVGSCDVLLALIGRDWLASADGTGQRRIDNPSDFVRLEIEAALQRDVRIFPLLVQGATMPDGSELPGELTRLARRNALELSDTRWNYDVERLEQALATIHEQYLAKQGPASVADAPAVPVEPASAIPAEPAAMAEPAAAPHAREATPPPRQPPSPAGAGFFTPRVLAILGAIAVVVIVVVIVAASGGGSSKPKTAASAASSKGAAGAAGGAVANGTGPCGRANLDACFPTTVNGGHAAPPALPTAETGPGTEFALAGGVPSTDSGAQTSLGAALAVSGTYTATGKQEVVVLAAFPSASGAESALGKFHAQESSQGCQTYETGNLSTSQGKANGNWQIFSCANGSGQGGLFFIDDETFVTFNGLSGPDTLRFLTSWVGNGS